MNHTGDRYLASFREQYCIPDKEWAPSLWEPTASCLQKSFAILTQALSSVSISEDTGFYLRAVENMVGRLYDVSASMVSCLACGTTGGVESLARVVIEGSWTTRFILDGDYKKRMFAYLFHYTLEHPRRLSEWQQVVKESRPNDKLTLARIEARRNYAQKMQTFLNSIREGAGQPDIDVLMKDWKKSLFARCESLGDQEKYYTHYHRLSADSHHNAEQTINFLFGYFAEAELGIKDCISKVGYETIHYSSMMAAFAIDEAIVAAIAACETFGGMYDQAEIVAVRLRIKEHAMELSKSAGVPFSEP